MGEKITISGSGYVATGDRASEAVEMEFSDGKHLISEAVVAHLGGTEAVRNNANSFRTHTYEEFREGFWTLVAQDRVRKAMEAVKNNHLGSFTQP